MRICVKLIRTNNILYKKTGEMDANQVREDGLDKFYTLPSYSKKCIDNVCNMYNITTWDLIIEPSAGQGSFLFQIPSENKLGLDILPEHPDILRQDFFTYSPPPDKTNILVIGNPPFGKISSIAVKFFNHAAQWANVIAFIVPRTFRKTSIQNKLNRHFHLKHDEDVPCKPCCFSPPMAVKCCFQIWEKKNVCRQIVDLPTSHPHWRFLPLGEKDERGQPTPPLNADFALRAYGGKIGEIKRSELQLLRPKSWHWIKVNTNTNTDIDIETLVTRFRQLDYSNSTNTARQNSMGRGELVQLYTDYIS